MRLDKLTTKFQEALGEAQSLALGKDHAYIEPAHLLLAMLRQADGPKSLLQRAGVNVPGLTKATEEAVNRLPEVQGQEQVQPGPDLIKLLQATEKEAIKRGDQFIASELFLLALADSKGELGRSANEHEAAAAMRQAECVFNLRLGAGKDHALHLAGARLTLCHVGGADHGQAEVACSIAGRAKVAADIGHIGEGQGSTKGECEAGFSCAGTGLRGHCDLTCAKQRVPTKQP